jgi:hypothetical protein
LLNWQAHDDKLIALKESAWQGRSGGMDIDRNSDGDLLRESIRLRKKNLQRGELPPINDNYVSDVSWSALVIQSACYFIVCFSQSPTMRTGSAPEIDFDWNSSNALISPDGIMDVTVNNINKNSTITFKKPKKVSETERRLENRCFLYFIFINYF